MKYDSAGGVVWTRQLGTTATDIATAVATGGSGTILLTGCTHGSMGAAPIGEDDLFLVKLDGSGGELWSRQIGTPLFDAGLAVAADHAGNILVGGTMGSSKPQVSLGDGDAFLAKFDPTGSQLWSREFGAILAGDLINGVAVDVAGDVYVSGATFGDLAATNPDPAFPDIFVAKFSALGDMLWLRQYGTDGPDRASSVAVDPFGEIYVSGSVSEGMLFGPGVGASDGFLMKLSPAGTLSWALRIGTATTDESLSVTAARQRHATCFGHTFGDLAKSAGRVDVFVMDLGECYADCDEDGRLDVFDFLCFQDAFAHGAAYADCETDGQFDVFDFLCFQDAFVTGCD